MKLYAITNPGTLQQVPYARDFPRHLVLAQVLDRQPSLCNLVSQLLTEGKEVILDNGAYEGVRFPVQQYVALATALRPSTVVLPDRIGEPSEVTRKLSLETGQDLRRKGFHGKFMYVPQGRTCEEVLDAFDEAMENWCSTKVIIGFGKCYTLWGSGEAAREALVNEVFLNERSKDWKFHLLGARWNPTSAFAEDKRIIGIDTMKLVRCAAEGIVYPQKAAGRISHGSGHPVDETLLRDNVLSFCNEYGAEDA